MLIVPRQYQRECEASLYDYFGRATGNPVCALPTGTGKSVIIAMFLESIFKQYPRQKVVILTHVKELIKQNYEKLLMFWPGAPAGVNSAGLGQRDIHMPIVFAGIGSVAKHAAQFGHVDLVIIDEAHLVSPTEETMYQIFLAGLKSVNPLLKVIGFTATPWRAGSGRITEDGIFTDLAFDITGMEAFNRLIAEGYLAPLTPKKTTTLLDVNGVHLRGGEFIASELQQAVDVDKVTEAALRESLEMGHNRKHWLIFASGVKHAENIAGILTALGEPCLCVHSKMPDKQRDDNIKDFKKGKVRAIVNNNVLTTGFDMPGIDFIVMLRPTASTVLWIQMLGRGTRPCADEQKTDCLVGDFAGNTKRLGPINDPVIPKKKGNKVGDAPIKLCDQCSTYNHASVRFCTCCGAEFPVSVKITQTASTQEIIKGELPVVEIFKVDHISITQYDKHGRPPSMRVSYYCGLKCFDEFVCIEHGGYAARKAQQWWAARTHEQCPSTTLEAMMLAEHLKAPTHLRVWTNKKYPELMACCFDGTAFGTQEAKDSDEGPEIQAHFKDTRRSPAAVEVAAHKRDTVVDNYDDDIPF
jgi:DNA repair protein RadD